MSSLANALIPQESSYSAQSHAGYKSNDDHMDDDSDQDVSAQPQDEEMQDLFGNADEDGEEAAPNDTHDEDNSEAVSEEGDAEAEQRRALEYEEDENPQELAIEVREAEVSFPNLPMPASSNGENWVIRMPNFVKVDSKPFHPETYIGPEQEDEYGSQAESLREKSMTIKLKVENTLRWRWVKDKAGNDIRQSNSRIIRWSDGTLSLRLGKELFDITKSVDTAGAVPRNLGVPPSSQSSQQQSQSQSSSALPKSQGLTYLVAQHKRSQVLQAEAVVTGHMSLRPTGMQSETHRMLVRAVGQKHNKVARLRMAPDPQVDPEREKMELAKQSAKKSKQRPSFGGAPRKKRSHRRNLDDWSDEDDEEHLPDDDDGGRPAGSSKRKKRDDEETGGYQEDDFLVADDSDEEAGSGRRKRKEEEEDPLDKLDAKIQRATKGRHDESGDEEDGDGDAGMDVESEEEEDQKVRKPGASSRKRQQPLYDDDDDDDE